MGPGRARATLRCNICIGGPIATSKSVNCRSKSPAAGQSAGRSRSRLRKRNAQAPTALLLPQGAAWTVVSRWLRLPGLMCGADARASCVAARRRRRWRTRGRRSRALLDPSQEQTPGLVRLSALHALVRDLQPRLPADEGGARLHAAAGPAPDRGLYAGRVAGPLHRREYPQGDRRRIRVGRRRPGQRHARPGASKFTISPSARTRPGKVVMLGGPSASASPEMYPDIDYLHIGEMGDATDQLIALPR